MHLSIETACGTCHSTERWKPAAFDHVRYFVFDNDHRTECATCHKDQDYKKYTCYGCHEHTSSKIRDEHIEEGISDFENCVRCHRSGDKHEAKQETRKNREKHDNDDD